ncbi:hypothetical protein BMW23_0882 [Bodo saltans virus]|uniref:Transmembrane protein n=1 Tax=Bodo saltans virus TaxID=2024608 RepID=A0A2H4UVN1_9VIRU|nr:hypothetical protein QJ851_gp0864 [Bodo saltans virus]ATZ80927.1 hypothetical protein BMW23_0882 [Bodo saltans virus]
MSDNEINDFVNLKKMSAEINANNDNFENVLNIDSPNLNINELSMPKEMSVPREMTIQQSQQIQNIDPKKRLIMKPKMKRVLFQSENNNQITEPNTNNDQLVVLKQDSEIDFFNIGSYNIPKQTLYLVIVLILVGALIWYLTCRQKQVNDDEKNN